MTSPSFRGREKYWWQTVMVKKWQIWKMVRWDSQIVRKNRWHVVWTAPYLLCKPFDPVGPHPIWKLNTPFFLYWWAIKQYENALPRASHRFRAVGTINWGLGVGSWSQILLGTEVKYFSWEGLGLLLSHPRFSDLLTALRYESFWQC